MANKVVLVSGAAGFIGRWSVPPLLARGYEVHAVTGHRAGAPIPAELSGAVVHCADLLDARATDALLSAVKPTALLHFAWVATPGVYWNSPDNARWLEASRHLLTRFRECGGTRVVMAGSCAEYDWSCGGVCHELTTPLADTAGVAPSAYADCKLRLGRALAQCTADHGLSGAWGRIFFQFGPAEHPARLVSSVIRSLLAGHPAACTHGRQVRSFLHVADVGAAFAALLDSTLSGPVNIGAAERVSIAELLESIAAQLGRRDLLQLGARAAAAGEPDLLVPDTRRLDEELRWRPARTLTQGIADTIDWWRGQPMAES